MSGTGPIHWRTRPYELCSWNHRFDDRERRFRTVYCAEHPETSLREVLADLRPNLAAREASSTRSPRGVGW